MFYLAHFYVYRLVLWNVLILSEAHLQNFFSLLKQLSISLSLQPSTTIWLSVSMNSTPLGDLYNTVYLERMQYGPSIEKETVPGFSKDLNTDSGLCTFHWVLVLSLVNLPIHSWCRDIQDVPGQRCSVGCGSYTLLQILDSSNLFHNSLL
jgi:hypothetical protein